jgi:anti-anti-sigma regulatory factor/HAMP domain-containing protein
VSDMPERDIGTPLKDLFSDTAITESRPEPALETPQSPGTQQEPSTVEPVAAESRDDGLHTAEGALPQGWRGGLAGRLRRAFLVLTLVPLLIAGLIAARSARMALETKVSQGQTIAATQASLLVSTYVHNLADGLVLFAKARDIGRLEDVALLDALRGLFDQFPDALDRIVLLDVLGQELADGTPFLTLLVSEPVSWADKDVFVVASRGQNHVDSQPASEEDVLSVTTIGVPVQDSRGQVVGVLVATLNPRRLWREVSQVDVGQAASVYVVDKHGRLVAYHDVEQPVRLETLTRLEGVKAFVDATSPSATAVEVYEGLMEQSVIGAYAPVADTSWAVVVELPTKEAFSALRPMTVFFVVLFALTAVLAVGAGSVLADRIVAPVLRLRDSALALGQGDLDRVIEIQTGDELEELAEAFSLMAQSLQASRTEREAWARDLEAQVADRTRELQELVDRQGFLLQTIWELSIPVVPVMEGVIVLPLVGLIDAARGRQVVEGVINGLKAHHARFVILDITGVPEVDEEVASYLLQATRTTRLLGAQPILVGVTPAVARALVGLSADLGRIVTRTDLQAGVEYARQTLRQQPFA